MEAGVIVKHYLVAFSSLFCGIVSILLGGFGVPLLDKVLHLLIFITISLESYYLLSLDEKKHIFRVFIMILFLVIYSSLIYPMLFIFCLTQLILFLFLSRKINKESPDIAIDSPLVFGFKTLPIWLLALDLSYCFPVFLLN